MFIDSAKISISSGRGGDGAVSFRRERFVPRGGPDGGDGGNGGDVIFIGKHNTHTLSDFRSHKEYNAENGHNGMHKKMHGKSGNDLVIPVPLGTVIKFNQTEQIVEILSDDQQYVAAKGGRGGWGNIHFATSIKQAPEWSKKGLDGQHYDLDLELKLIADVGLVGLPNAGKSTLLSVLSNARPKIANYPFTTLQPELGVMNVGDTSLVIADIPGLIEGAHIGKGLGTAFLKHIARTKALLFLLDGSDENIKTTYQLLLNELKQYDLDLLTKQNLVVITKIDLISSAIINKIRRQFKNAVLISAATGAGLDALKQSIVNLLGSK